MMVLTTDSSPEVGQFMPSVVYPCPFSLLTTLHISSPEEGVWCSVFPSLLYAFASLAVNHCCLESEITGVGVSPASLIGALCGVVHSTPSLDLAC